jgi:adenylate cyclase
MADVFVSYSRTDRGRVAPLVAAIEAEGWSVWWDPEIMPGQEFDSQIAAELALAMAVLVVWTPASVKSRWVRGEAREAADRGILVPVRFEATSLPIDVRALHTTDLDDSGGLTQIGEVLRALGAMIAHQRALQPPPEDLESASAAPIDKPARFVICVLPFANMSGDPEQEYFSDGITEDIITDLSKVSALAVISRNSAFVYKGRHVDIPKVARELKVTHVLEGSVRKAGGRVRITAQLVDASSNDHLWAERYDRDLNDIFALQDEISGAIVKALRVRLLPQEKHAIEQRGTENVEAYNLYLMARQLYVTGHDADARRAEAVIRLCSRAAAIDPCYARAWALLAVGQMTLRFDLAKGGDDGLAAAERALTLDANLAEAHAVKARILSEYGRTDAAAAEIDAALRLDPESYEVNRSAGKFSYRARQWQDAIRYYEKAMTLMESDLHSVAMLPSSYLAAGNPVEALRTARLTLSRAEKAVAVDPTNGVAMAFGAYALATLGEGERSKEWMRRALAIDPDNLSARYNFACALSLHLEDTDAALEMLGPVLANRSLSMVNHTKIDPDFDRLRADPRFLSMIAEAEARLAAAAGGESAAPLSQAPSSDENTNSGPAQ